MTAGLTLDTGALIALERRRSRALRLLRLAVDSRRPVTVPVAVVAEWWRGRTDLREAILASLLVEPMDLGLARTVGDALAAVRGSSLVDAIVAASAARRGDVILTSDPSDLVSLASHFGSLRVLAV